MLPDSTLESHTLLLHFTPVVGTGVFQHMLLHRITHTGFLPSFPCAPKHKQTHVAAAPVACRCRLSTVDCCPPPPPPLAADGEGEGEGGDGLGPEAQVVLTACWTSVKEVRFNYYIIYIITVIVLANEVKRPV